MKDDILLLANVSPLPFPLQVLQLLHSMVVTNHAVTQMGTTWGLAGLEVGVDADRINNTVRGTLRHLANTNVLSLRYVLNDLDVPDELRTLYAGYLFQCCLGCAEDQISEMLEKAGELTDLLSTAHIPRVDQPDRPNIITKTH